MHHRRRKPARWVNGVPSGAFPQPDGGPPLRDRPRWRKCSIKFGVRAVRQDWAQSRQGKPYEGSDHNGADHIPQSHADSCLIQTGLDRQIRVDLTTTVNPYGCRGLPYRQRK